MALTFHTPPQEVQWTEGLLLAMFMYFFFQPSGNMLMYERLKQDVGTELLRLGLLEIDHSRAVMN